MQLDILANELARHVLTRSFRSKRFLVPDLNLIALDDQPLLVATVGFWADLDADGQRAFVDGHRPAAEPEHDDRGALSITRNKSDCVTIVTATGDQPAPNRYVRQASSNA